MRLIGQLESKQHAERFAAYLTTKEISSHVEPENGSWEIWIRDEDQINSAVDFLNEFKTDPEGMVASTINLSFELCRLFKKD